MSNDVWTIAKARAQLNDLIDRAERVGPQVITRNGRKTAIVVAARDWERKTRRGTLAEFFAASPLHGSA